MSRESIARRAAWIGVVANTLLSFAKILVGFLFNSTAVLADGVDTATDIFTSLITLVSSRISGKPPDKTHPYGHERAEAIAAKIVSFVIFYAGANLLVSSLKGILQAQHGQVLGIMPLVVSMISVAVKTWLFAYKRRIGKLINSSVFLADALNMRNDILISSTVFAGVAVSKLGFPWMDGIVALFVSLMIMKTAFEIFKETSYELMDGIQDFGIYEEIFRAVEQVPCAANPHKVRVRKVGYKYFVDMDIEVNADITVAEGHEIATNVKSKIMNLDDRIADVMVHVEPFGNIENEAYGLTKKTVHRDRSTLE